MGFCKLQWLVTYMCKPLVSEELFHMTEFSDVISALYTASKEFVDKIELCIYLSKTQ